MAFDPNEPRDEVGKWTDAAGGKVPKYILNKIIAKETDDHFNEGNKVVNADGSPKTVYHVTNERFDKFDLKKTAQGIIWFTDSKQSIIDGTTGAGLRPGKEKIILERQISIKKPARWAEYEKLGIGQLKDRGFDGVILPDQGVTNYIVFKTSQIRKVK